MRFCKFRLQFSQHSNIKSCNRIIKCTISYKHRSKHMLLRQCRQLSRQLRLVVIRQRQRLVIRHQVIQVRIVTLALEEEEEKVGGGDFRQKCQLNYMSNLKLRVNSIIRWISKLLQELDRFSHLKLSFRNLNKDGKIIN